MRMPLATIVVTATLVLSGCAGKNGLRDIHQQGQGPDEFGVMPVKPLTAPKDYQFLPAPTPGGANLTDPTPKADAIAALGGNPAALNAGSGVPSGDQALVSASSRYGVPSNTREVLAKEDAEFRSKQLRFSRLRLFPEDRYAEFYRNQSLNADAQAEAFRRAGYPTPSAPPPSDE